MKKLKLKIIHDNSPECPFDNTDGLYPCITENKDYSDGDIDRYLSNYLTRNQMVRHQKKLCRMIDIDYQGFCMDYPESDERIDTLSDELSEFIGYSMENKAEFCELFNIKHLFQISRGYSQGDSSEVFICWTTEFENISGLSYKDVTYSDMEGTFKLYGYWAWGDVFGFKVIEKEKCDVCGHWKKTEIESVWGFYGQNHFESGLAEHVRHHFEHMNDEEFKTMIEGIEIKYPRY